MMRLASPSLPRAGLLLAGVAATLTLRVAVGGSDGVQSAPAGLAFAAALGGLALFGGWRPGPFRVQAAAWGVFGAAVLVAGPAWFRWSEIPFVPWPATGQFPLWAAVVTTVAVAEEVVLRGVLFTALARNWGAALAAVITAAVFGLIHVPLYGWSALPLDLAVGLWLGGLRMLTGGVTAPALAHTLADLAAWWLL